LSDVHVPKLESHGRGKTALKLVLEVALISIGVFLGLLGEQWRENAHQRDLAKDSLRRFRAEIVENRKAVTDVVGYHTAVQKEIQAVVDKGLEHPSGEGIHFHGIQPARFDRSAWELAIATQSLAYVDSDLALSLANIYNLQGTVTELTRSLAQAMYATPPIDEKGQIAFFGAALVYYGDMTIYEPQLLEMYDEIVPRIDGALVGKTKAVGEGKKASAEEQRASAEEKK
jgi:hypothetical protein